MDVSLYVFADSHPCETAIAATRAKGIDFRRVELPPVLHRGIMRVRFGHGTVPGMIVDGERVQGTSAIMRRLDELRPEPPLFPADPAARAAVEAAEAWGAGPFQDIGRRLVWGHMVKSPEALAGWIATNPDPRMRWVTSRLSRVGARTAAWANAATDENVQADLRAVPHHLDRVDELIAEGVIGGEQPNAADFQILASIGLWMVLADLRPAIIDRPSGRAAARLFPGYLARDGVAAGVLPAAWFAPLRG